MLIVMKTYSTDQYNDADYDTAIFKMEDVEAKLIAQRWNVYKLNKNSDPHLAEMAFNVMHCSEVSCEFYPSTIWDGADGETDAMPKNIRDDLEKQHWSAVDSLSPDIGPRDAHAPAYLFLMFCDQGFFWRTSPQDSHLHIDTEVLPYDLLSRVL